MTIVFRTLDGLKAKDSYPDINPDKMPEAIKRVGYRVRPFIPSERTTKIETRIYIKSWQADGTVIYEEEPK